MTRTITNRGRGIKSKTMINKKQIKPPSTLLVIVIIIIIIIIIAMIMAERNQREDILPKARAEVLIIEVVVTHLLRGTQPHRLLMSLPHPRSSPQLLPRPPQS
jgi:hypothetical protein